MNGHNNGCSRLLMISIRFKPLGPGDGGATQHSSSDMPIFVIKGRDYLA